MTRSELVIRLREGLARRGRTLLVLGAAGAALLALVAWRSDDLDRRLLLAKVRLAGMPVKRNDPLVFQLSRDADRGERRLTAARVLFLNRAKVESKRLDTVAERTRRLKAVEGLAAEALDALPASWEASMLLGAARFELRLVARDARLFSDAQRWELPLSAAVARSHGGSEAEQSLAAAYLEVYPALSRERRPQVAEVIRHSLANRSFRLRELQRWFVVSGSLENAELLLPTDSATLGALGREAWRRSSLESGLDYFSRQRRTLQSEFSRTLEAALRETDSLSFELASRLVNGIVDSPVDDEFAPLVTTALDELPPREHIDPRLTDAAVRWLSWAQPICLLWECPLPPRSFDQLSQLGASKLGSEATAFAALAAGDTERAERLAKESGALVTEAWAPYLLFAARKRLERNEPGMAALLLSKLSPREVDRPIVGSLKGRTGVLQAAGANESLAQESWGPALWRKAYPTSWLELGARRRATGIVIDFSWPPKQDLLLALEWDGRRLGPGVVRSGATSIRIPVEITPGIHLLRLSPREGVLPNFGTTRLD